MKYEELNIIYKYLYNKVSYDEFSQALKAVVPHAEDIYIDEKWELYKRDMGGFLATFDKEFFNAIIKQIEESGYKG